MDRGSGKLWLLPVTPAIQIAGCAQTLPSISRRDRTHGFKWTRTLNVDRALIARRGEADRKVRHFLLGRLISGLLHPYLILVDLHGSELDVWHLGDPDYGLAEVLGGTGSPLLR